MKVIHGGDVWQGGAPGEWLDFSANLNPDGPPEWVRAAMAEGLARARWYPDIAARAATRGLSACLGLPGECLLVTAGGIEAAALAATLSDRHAVAQPTFQEYGHLCGDFRGIPREKLHDAPLAQGECLWVCNPNNPTGEAMGREALSELLRRAERAGARLIVDEAFIHYCPERSVAEWAPAHPALIVLGSLTKVLAIPGVRLGYMAAHPDVTQTLAERRTPWQLNCVADAVAAALPGHEGDFEAIRARNARRRERFAEGLRGLGIGVLPSDANFLLCDFGRDARPMIEALRQRRILVRPCGMFPGLTHAHVRLCVRTEAENDALLRALAEV